MSDDLERFAQANMGDSDVFSVSLGNVIVTPDAIVLSLECRYYVWRETVQGEQAKLQAVAVIKDSDNIKFYANVSPLLEENHGPKGDFKPFVLNDGIYWEEPESTIDRYDEHGIVTEKVPGCAKKFDWETGLVSTLHTRETKSNWDYSPYTFAEGGLMMYYGFDRSNEKRYLYEIRNGVETETDVTDKTKNGPLPAVINFVKVN